MLSSLSALSSRVLIVLTGSEDTLPASASQASFDFFHLIGLSSCWRCGGCFGASSVIETSDVFPASPRDVIVTQMTSATPLIVRYRILFDSIPDADAAHQQFVSVTDWHAVDCYLNLHR